MIDERFSADCFTKCGLNTDVARKLADQLADEIQEEMHRVIREHFLKIIDRLNAMGHSLQEYEPIAPGYLAFRDDWEDETGYHCKLLVAFDSIVTTGYAHTIDIDEAYKEYE